MVLAMREMCKVFALRKIFESKMVCEFAVWKRLLKSGVGLQL